MRRDYGSNVPLQQPTSTQPVRSSVFAAPQLSQENTANAATGDALTRMGATSGTVAATTVQSSVSTDGYGEGDSVAGSTLLNGETGTEDQEDLDAFWSTMSQSLPVLRTQRSNRCCESVWQCRGVWRSNGGFEQRSGIENWRNGGSPDLRGTWLSFQTAWGSQGGIGLPRGEVRTWTSLPRNSGCLDGAQARPPWGSVTDPRDCGAAFTSRRTSREAVRRTTCGGDGTSVENNDNFGDFCGGSP